MADILVCCQARDTSNIMAGDVVAVLPDGHVYGECEMGGRRADPDNNLLDAAAGLTQGELVMTVAKTDGVVEDPVIATGIAKGAQAGRVSPVAQQAVFAKRLVDDTGEQQFETVSIDDHPNGNHPFFRIIHLPNVSAEALANLLTPVFSTDPIGKGQTPAITAYRAVGLDPTTFTDQDLITYWNDDTRIDGSYVWNVAEADWPQYTVVRFK